MISERIRLWPIPCSFERMAVEIEEPFGVDRNDLPLDELAEVIASDVASLLGNRESVAAHSSPVPAHS